MDLVRLTENAYQLRGGSNAGLIVQDGKAVLVDTGLDKDTAKKILRHVDALHAKLAAVVITHAHADHFGGAATIRARTSARVYAPVLEAAIVENPILEPLYLFSGAMPPAELRHKFTLGDACKVDEVLSPGEITLAGVPLQVLSAPGHAPNQVMVAGGGACFVADAVFAPDVLAKHGVPFMVDVDAWLNTLAEAARLDGAYEAFVPGHGPAVAAIGPWAAENATRLQEIRRCVAEAAAQTSELAGIIKICADRLNMNILSLTIYLLTQTAILACLASLQTSGQVQLGVQDNRVRAEPAPPLLSH
jgi:glyoxylase-like metal-dependent hydrolase (beta-lactamase superfamily II)